MCFTISAPKNMSGSKIIPTGIMAIMNTTPTAQSGTTIQEVTMANIILQIISNIIFIFVFIVSIPLFYLLFHQFLVVTPFCNLEQHHKVYRGTYPKGLEPLLQGRLLRPLRQINS